MIRAAGLWATLLLALPCRAQESGTGWKPWSPRDEIAPRCSLDAKTFRSAPDSLAVSGNDNPSAYGGWVREVGDLKDGKHYKLTAYYRTEKMTSEPNQVVARIDWLGTRGKRVGYPDYGYLTEPAGDWTRVTIHVPAPEGAARARIELLFGWAPKGTVWWDDISFEEAPPPPKRPVRIGSVAFRPRNTGGKKQSLDAFLDIVDKVGTEKPDVICLGEAITLVGHAQGYAAVAEPVPGPSTEALGERARRHNAYIVAGLVERDGTAIYNTGVLIDRQGKLAGKYRKVYLPREELEGGITPGDSYPVFQTDFGKVGIMICYDVFFTDPAKALAVQGAEILFLPVWGCKYDHMKVRASENHVYVVSAGYDVESAVINPVGEPLHASKESGTVKVIEVDLNQRFVEKWLGDMRARYHKELRWDVPVPAPKK